MDKRFVAKYLIPMQPLPTGLTARGTLKQPVACILFDVYGTLFISGSGDISVARSHAPQGQQLRALLERYGAVVSPEMLVKNLFQRIEKAHEHLHARGIDFPEVEIDQIWQEVLELDDREAARRIAIEFEMIVNPVYPMPHLVPMLQACRDRKIILGLISNAQFFTPLLFEWFLDADLATLGFRSDLTFLSYRFGFAKPSLKLFELARTRLDELGITSRSVLCVGNDMLNDVYPAARSGFASALFAGDARSLRLRTDDPRCRFLSPDLIVTDLLQLCDCL